MVKLYSSKVLDISDQKGIASANSFTTVGAKTVQANTISMANTTSSVSVEMSGANSTVQSANVIINKTATINELRLGNHVNNGVLIGRTFNKRIDFVAHRLSQVQYFK